MQVDRQKMTEIDAEFGALIKRRAGLAGEFWCSPRPFLHQLQVVAAERVRRKTGNEGEVLAMIDFLKSER